jgi:hypothetical protein
VNIYNVFDKNDDNRQTLLVFVHHVLDNNWSWNEDADN